jgi:hypothetical protein
LHKYSLKKDSQYYYHNGSAWVVADGTYLQTNTVAEIVANASTFTIISVGFNVKIFLHSEDGQTTPNIDQLVITYDFSGESENARSFCSVYWYARNLDGTVCDDVITFRPSAFNVRYKTNTFICQTAKNTVANSSTAYVECDLLENENMVDINNNPVTYEVFVGARKIGNISVPDQPGALLWDILV